MDVEKNPDLKNRKLFTQKGRLILGIPDKLFMGSVVVIVAMAFLINFFIAVIIGGMVLIPLYIIHKDDPQAFQFYIESLYRPVRFEAAKPEPRQFVLVREFADRFEFSFYQPQKHKH